MMYVNPFWFGVGATILAELVAAVLWSLSSRNKRSK